MNTRWAWTFAVLSSLAVTLATATTSAQFEGGYAMAGPQAPYSYPPGAMMAGGYPAPGMMAMQPIAYMNGPTAAAPPGSFPGPTPALGGPGSFSGPMPGGMPGQISSMPDAYGAYGELPPDYGMGMPEGTGCPYCGGHGCDACRHMHGHHRHGGILGLVHHGPLAGWLHWILPYPDGGCAAIRWYDIAVDGMMLQRENAGRNVAFASDGIGGPIVLQTDDLDFEEEPSFRFSAAFQAGPGSNYEFTYYGLFHYSDRAFVNSPGDTLFSVFSGFGLAPPNGFAETDSSDFQQIVYTSTFDSFEVNFRQRWMSANCRYQGSWLIGARHFMLDEEFQYLTSSSFNSPTPAPAQATFDVVTFNNLTGMQVGGDLWICLIPGLRLGAEAKAGVYYNDMDVNTDIAATTTPVGFREELDQNDVALLGDASVYLTYRLTYQWTARFGYHALYVEGVALAGENFNTTPPAILFPTAPGTRVPTVNDDGEIFYHGWFGGVEFMW
jgi:hypothetical protein